VASLVFEDFSGRVSCTPRERHAPRDEAELVRCVRAARGPLRPVGSGHSGAPLCATDAEQISLEHLQGIESIDRVARRAWIRAGTTLHALGPPLWEAGFSLRNQGDVDVQALAGAIATGTHGTGPTLGSMSTQVEGLRLVLASGDVWTCTPDQHPDVLEAGRVSLGALGVVSAICLALEPAYWLHEREWKEDVEPGLEQLQARGDAPRHMEFWWLPGIDALYMKSLHPTDADPASVVGQRRERIGRSFEIFPSLRADPFYEIEYAVPEAAGPTCFRALRAWLRQHHADVSWPIEYRTLAADEIPLGMAFQRASVTLSVHQARGLPYERLFADAEAILREHGGRPHWGKAHSLTAHELAPLYPRWADFARIRRALDPQGRFLSPYLRELLGV